jgi:hypothetical protein
MGNSNSKRCTGYVEITIDNNKKLKIGHGLARKKIFNHIISNQFQTAYDVIKKILT